MVGDITYILHSNETGIFSFFPFDVVLSRCISKKNNLNTLNVVPAEKKFMLVSLYVYKKIKEPQ